MMESIKKILKRDKLVNGERNNKDLKMKKMFL